jgi:hypothetical protein
MIITPVGHTASKTYAGTYKVQSIEFIIKQKLLHYISVYIGCGNSKDSASINKSIRKLIYNNKSK